MEAKIVTPNENHAYHLYLYLAQRLEPKSDEFS